MDGFKMRVWKGRGVREGLLNYWGLLSHVLFEKHTLFKVKINISLFPSVSRRGKINQ